MTMLRKKISMGTSASTSSGRIGAMRRSTPTPPANQRTVSIAAVKSENPRDMFYRDEVFDVKVTVTGTRAYKLQLGFAKGETHQTLGSRGKVQMYDFQNDGILVFQAVPTDTKRTKTLKAVINTAQIVRLKITEVVEDDTSNSESPTPNPEPSVLAETGDIHIVHRLRQYATSYGWDPNTYDSKINEWLNYWDDWNIGNPVHTFIVEARPSGDLVKAVAYEESSLSTAKIKGTERLKNPDLMQLTPVALNAMTIQPKDTKKEDRVTENDANASENAAAAQRMNYGTLNEGHTVENYTVTDGPTDGNVDDSLKWGIRWLIAKRTKFNGTVTIRDWWGTKSALRAYNGEEGKEVEYPLAVEKLYAEGKNSQEGSPKYLWPVKVDGSARQPAKAAATPENPPAENPENPPQE